MNYLVVVVHMVVLEVVHLFIGDCDDSSAIWKFNNNEIRSSFLIDGNVCLTTGWPFLQVGAFVTPPNNDDDDDSSKNIIIVLNEANEPANYIINDENNGKK